MRMNLPNQLTLLRLALIPAFMGFMFVDNFWTRISSLVIFIVASITDWYDGKLARETNTVTVIGTFLDPLVDKLLIAAALIGFVEIHELHIPAWMVVLVICREFLITGLRSLAASRGVVMAAEKAGKWKTAAQITAVITILVILTFDSATQRWPFLDVSHSPGWPHIVYNILPRIPYWFIFIATVITVLSGYFYIRKYRPLLKKEFSVVRAKPGAHEASPTR